MSDVTNLVQQRTLRSQMNVINNTSSSMQRWRLRNKRRSTLINDNNSATKKHKPWPTFCVAKCPLLEPYVIIRLKDSRPWNAPLPVFCPLLNMGKMQSRIFSEYSTLIEEWLQPQFLQTRTKEQIYRKSHLYFSFMCISRLFLLKCKFSEHS